MKTTETVRCMETGHGLSFAVDGAEELLCISLPPAICVLRLGQLQRKDSRGNVLDS